jgi:predicted nucleic acid-binding protein
MITTEIAFGDRCLVDSNVLLYLTLAEGIEDISTVAVERLREKGVVLCVTPQNVAEFWNVCTRPLARNGLGYSPEKTHLLVRGLEEEFLLLHDSADTYTTWRKLVQDHAVSGKQVHDTKLAANMLVHGISWILTRNRTDFKRFPFCTVLDPAEVS